jgi:uncharacterized protein Usg
MFKKYKILKGKYRIATAEIFYHIPDFPELLQTYIWQEFDIAPKFPVLNKFLIFWEKNLDGKLHSVRIASKSLACPQQLHFADTEFNLH